MALPSILVDNDWIKGGKEDVSMKNANKQRQTCRTQGVGDIHKWRYIHQHTSFAAFGENEMNLHHSSS